MRNDQFGARATPSRNAREGRYVGWCARCHLRVARHAGNPDEYLAYWTWCERHPQALSPRRAYVSKPALARLQQHVLAALDARDGVVAGMNAHRGQTREK